MEQWVISETASIVPLPRSGSGRVGSATRNVIAPAWADPGTCCGQYPLLGEGAVPTHITSWPAVPSPPFVPKQVLSGGNGTLSTYQERPLTASRSFLCRRDFWTGTDHHTGCQWGGGRGGEESHMWESISRKPPEFGGGGEVLGLRTSAKVGEGKVYLYVQADWLSHSFKEHRIAPTQ